MNNGHYASSSGDYSPAHRNWFDAYDGGSLGVGYLGQPVAGPAGSAQTASWQKGVWKREFQGGIVLWNPRGNGPQTLDLTGLGNLKRLRGTQAPTVNSGAVVTGSSVRLQDRERLILLRY